MEAQVDRKDLIEKLGGEAAVAGMSHEARADALEDHLAAKLDATTQPKKKKYPTVAEYEEMIDTRGYRRGVGRLMIHDHSNKNPDLEVDLKVPRLPKMPDKPKLVDFFKLRLTSPAHLLQSARLARTKGTSEEIIMACLLHDAGQALMKADHGWWCAQLIEPYVSERVAFAVRYHQALRFYPDAEAGYDYPESYFLTFGVDYVPPPHVKAAHEYARNHKYYMDARLVTTNDLYSFDPNVKVGVEEFEDIIGRHFKQPEEGLGYDNTPVSHMWRTMINPDSPL